MFKKSYFSFFISSFLCISALTGCGNNDEKKQYSVIFHNNNEIYQSQQVEEGNCVVKPETNPTMDEKIINGKYYSFTFENWVTDNQLIYDFNLPINSNLDLFANYTQTKITKTVKFMVNDELFTSIGVDKGSLISKPEDPEKEEDEYNYYTFEGWFNDSKKWDFNVDVVMDTDIILTARFEAHPIVYNTVTFKVDGVQYGDVVIIREGNKVNSPDAPSKEEAKEVDGKYYSYSFKEWQLDGVKYNFDTPVTKDLVINAAFEKTVIKKTVTFMNGEVEFDRTEVDKGAKVLAPHTNPTKESTDSKYYIFDKWMNGSTPWDFDNDVVTDDLTLTATFIEHEKRTVLFMNEDVPFEVCYVEVGEHVSAPTQVPQKAPEAKTGYIFDKWMNGSTPWDFDNDVVTDDITLTASYTTYDRKTITFLNEGDEFEVSYADIGDLIVAPEEVPEKADDEAPQIDGKYYSYSFDKWMNGSTPWDFDNNTIEDDLTLTASYISTTQKNTIKFMNGDNVFDEVTIDKGTILEEPASIPSKESSVSTDYKFEEWQLNGEKFDFSQPITENLVLDAYYSETIRKYHVAFYDSDGTLLQESDENYGTSPVEPINKPANISTAKMTYEFDTWNTTRVAGDVNYFPTYKEKEAVSPRVFELGANFSSKSADLENSSTTGYATWEFNMKSVMCNYYLNGGVSIKSPTKQINIFVNAAENKLYFNFAGWATIGSYSLTNASSGFNLDIKIVKTKDLNDKEVIMFFVNGNKVCSSLDYDQGNTSYTDGIKTFFGSSSVCLAPYKGAYRDDCSICVSNVDVSENHMTNTGNKVYKDTWSSISRSGCWTWNIDITLNQHGLGTLFIYLGVSGKNNEAARIAINDSEGKVYFSFGDYIQKGNIAIPNWPTKYTVAHIKVIKTSTTISAYLDDKSLGTIYSTDVSGSHDASSLFGVAPLNINMIRDPGLYNDTTQLIVSCNCIPTVKGTDDESAKYNDFLTSVLSGKYISILGDSISTFAGVSSDNTNNSTIGNDNAYYPDGYYLNFDVKNVTDTYWSMLCQDTGLELLVNNSIGGSTAKSTVNSRCVNLHADQGPLEGTDPDIIIVYIGINDIGAIAEGYSSDDFKIYYDTLVSKMLARYTNSDIFFCTLPSVDTKRAAHDIKKIDACNGHIRDILEKYEISDHLIELRNSSAESPTVFLCDGLHPNKAGMKALNGVIKKDLYKYYLSSKETQDFLSLKENYINLLKDDIIRPSEQPNSQIKGCVDDNSATEILSKYLIPSKLYEGTGRETLILSNGYYGPNTTNNYWTTLEHLEFTYQVCVKYLKTTDEDEANLLLDIALRLLDNWLANKYFTSLNWYYYRISVPQLLSAIALLLEPELNISEINDLKELISLGSVAEGEIRENCSGTNLIWYCESTLRYSLFLLDKNRFDYTKEKLVKQFILDQEQGLQSDGTFFMHGKMNYPIGYGTGFVQAITDILVSLDGSPYQFNQDCLDYVSSLICDAIAPYIHKGYIDYATSGRQAGSFKYLTTYLINFANSLTKIVTLENISRKDEILSCAESILNNSIDKLIDDTGVRFYSSTGNIVIHSNGTYISFKGLTNGLITGEGGSSKDGSGGFNEQNLLGINLSYGTTTTVMNVGGEYDGIAAYWDYSKIPGTTASQMTVNELKNYISDHPFNWNKNYGTFGGSQFGEYATSFVSFTHESTTINVSCFATPYGMVILGSNISDTSGRELYTTIEQCYYMGDMQVSQDGLSVKHNGIIYRSLYADQTIDASHGMVEYHYTDSYPTYPEATGDSADIFVATLNSAGKNTYAYSIQPEEEIENTFVVIVNNENVAAVELMDGTILACFYNTTSFTFEGVTYSGTKGQTKSFKA